MSKRFVFLVWLLAAEAATGQAPPPADAEPERFVVEVVVFRHVDAPPDVGGPPPEDVLPFGDELRLPLPGPDESGVDAETAIPSAPPLEYAPLPDEDRRLTPVWRQLAGSRAWEPLLHAGWIQDSFPLAGAPGFDVAQASGERPDLTGTIIFSHGRYPHLELDLRYRPEALAWEHPTWEGYPLHEQRRMRDDELHYFDAAHFGAIARVSRWLPEGGADSPEAPALDDAAAPARPDQSISGASPGGG
ncbi:hypothetical protein BH24PSE2_BH24PSE2_16260 [soil metagenome]